MLYFGELDVCEEEGTEMCCLNDDIFTVDYLDELMTVMSHSKHRGN